jgi:hypothetical protein
VESRRFHRDRVGGRLARSAVVIWFLERESELIICEIRRAADNEETFELEVAEATGPTTRRFDSAHELIATYLGEQTRLMAQGWRPRHLSTIE